jgi:hypothetical protein
MKPQIPSFSCLTQQTDKKINNPRTKILKSNDKPNRKKIDPFP